MIRDWTRVLQFELPACIVAQGSNSRKPETADRPRPARGTLGGGARYHPGDAGDGQIASNGSGEPPATSQGGIFGGALTARHDAASGRDGRGHAHGARSRCAHPTGVNGSRTMSGGALTKPARCLAPSTADAHYRKIIGPGSRPRRRAARCRRHGLLRPPTGGPLRPAALPVRSERPRGQSPCGSRTPG